MTTNERRLVIERRRQNPLRGIQDTLWDVRRSLHFRKTLKASVASHNKRSKAAKKAWAKRKAAA